MLLALRRLQTEAQRHAGPTDFLKFMVTASPPQPHSVGVRHTFVGLTSERCRVKLESSYACVFVIRPPTSIDVAQQHNMSQQRTCIGPREEQSSETVYPPPILYNMKKAFIVEGRRVRKAATSACGGHTREWRRCSHDAGIHPSRRGEEEKEEEERHQRKQNGGNQEGTSSPRVSLRDVIQQHLL